MSEAWSTCLDAFAEHLAGQRQALADGRPEDVGAYDAPTGLGPVPPGLGDRLRALSRENDELTTALAGVTASCARELQLLTVLHRPEPTTATFLDSRA